MENNCSFEHIIEKYQRGIFGYCFRMIRNFHAAQDIMQEVFIKYFSRFGNTDSARYMPAYLYRIAFNLCVDFIRKQSKISLVALEESVSDKESEIEENIIGPQYSKDIETGLNSLTPLQRSILILHAVDGLSHSEIAVLLGRREAAVRKQYQRARVNIEAKLSRERCLKNEKDELLSGI